ncbi:hypothetical protein A2526_05575 [candidate division WOR-1 bacterium RIFOXYD2_FULL_36_8]|uniref:Uncharacterized protein n=1 Tax=candidate division WOR-1 bacterium RIFOXYB2_FULL_36_35 TaxID=1802578 RepID=A0A1F4RY94_UNCSA|nr:MAG: hypothetical protein A2230_04175 [candidate division WOR-1 bacterium RIFOXYA2_FULL_36_21]OGC13141.1 MAG: hypothetical protein A2290_07520 [candidate division WOR-1 bacterium RIFOXYB2_FULL_36_35]OGC16913.1 MAG: hypothetical protein A2282_05675 [candidate division WOR-1 bacterium RIFOXYA12_FULL_36_13]OGC40520.1 MAG: hypothetical protein A2526_05575 [candidate division WOR-1 bacterium RIFOXYD2_FULL_36_8]
MTQTKHDLLQSLEKITNELAVLKRVIVMEVKPTPNGKHKTALDDLNKTIKQLSPKWDSISALEEIKSQREKK